MYNYNNSSEKINSSHFTRQNKQQSHGALFFTQQVLRNTEPTCSLNTIVLHNSLYKPGIISYYHGAGPVEQMRRAEYIQYHIFVLHLYLDLGFKTYERLTLVFKKVNHRKVQEIIQCIQARGSRHFVPTCIWMSQIKP